MGPSERYVLLRDEGLGVREAARRAGFASGKPSERACRLWEGARRLRAAGGSLTEEALSDYHRRIEAQRKRLREMEAIAEAAQILSVSEIAET